jgi:hypothetical protein
VEVRAWVRVVAATVVVATVVVATVVAMAGERVGVKVYRRASTRGSQQD